MSSFKMIQNLIDKYEIGRLSHAFLVETNNIDLCLEDIKLFIKYINCSEKYNENCNKCNLCKLIDLNNLPSLMIIEPDGMSIKKIDFFFFIIIWIKYYVKICRDNYSY